MAGFLYERRQAFFADGRRTVSSRAQGLGSQATNVIDGDDSVSNASPAASDGMLFLRSDRYAYCLGAK